MAAVDENKTQETESDVDFHGVLEEAIHELAESVVLDADALLKGGRERYLRPVGNDDYDHYTQSELHSVVWEGAGMCFLEWTAADRKLPVTEQYSAIVISGLGEGGDRQEIFRLHAGCFDGDQETSLRTYYTSGVPEGHSYQLYPATAEGLVDVHDFAACLVSAISGIIEPEEEEEEEEEEGEPKAKA
jgi:hypothetical protein